MRKCVLYRSRGGRPLVLVNADCEGPVVLDVIADTERPLQDTDEKALETDFGDIDYYGARVPVGELVRVALQRRHKEYWPKEPWMGVKL